MLIYENLFKRLLVFLLLLASAMLLLSMDYLQELNFYQNRLQLPEFKVNLQTYKLLKKLSLLNHNSIGSLSHQEKEFNLLAVDNKDDGFCLKPPFPGIDLAYVKPVFIENGYIHLYCELSFCNLHCTVSGRIPAPKAYFQTTHLANPKFEIISINFIPRSFFKTVQREDNWIEKQILEPNKNAIEIFTNYIIIFGANGTNVKTLFDKETIFLENNNQQNYYKFIHAQVCVLFILIYLKILNFLLFGTIFMLHFILHVPVYYINIVQHDFSKSQVDIFDVNLFDIWFKKNGLQEEIATPVEEFDNLPQKNSGSEISTAESSFRFRGSLKKYQKGIPILLSSPQKAITIHGAESDYSPFSLSTTGSSPIFSFIKPSHQYCSNKDLENQQNVTSLEPHFTMNDSVKTGNKKSCQVVRSLTERAMDTYCSIYFLSSFGVLLHLLGYEILNSILYNLIASVFLSIQTSDPKYLNSQRKSIFDIPNILLTGEPIFSNQTIGNVRTNSNMLFNTILNLFGYLLNAGFTLFFHSIYIFLIYRYTISIY